MKNRHRVSQVVGKLICSRRLAVNYGCLRRHDNRGQRGEAARVIAKAATSMALRQAQAVRQPAPFLQLLNEVGFLVRRNRPTVQTGIRTPRRTTRSEYRTLTDAQTILVQR